VRLAVGEHEAEETAEGNGPVHALATALKTLLLRHYPELTDVQLVDYKVRILSSNEGVASTVRVLVRASDGRSTWGTVGVSTNVIEASWRALVDAFEHKLMGHADADKATGSGGIEGDDAEYGTLISERDQADGYFS
jgi:2-isopropylmalate synthase